MIASLKGTIVDLAGSTVVVEVQGVGYEVRCSQACLAQLSPGAEAALVIYTDVKEDAINLYGFADRLEKHVFVLLTKVNGVGAKTAADIISRIDKRELLRVIGSGDLPKLQSIRGVGRKTAERIVVELKDRVAEMASEKEESRRSGGAGGEPFEDAVQALVALGFSRRDAAKAVDQVRAACSGAEIEPGRAVKEALRYI